MKQPKVSLIVTYKNEDNLKECLNTLLNQSFSDIEIICIGNAASDEAQEIVNSYAQKDTRIKLINLPLVNDNMEAKKAGLSLAGGDFICFVDYNKDLTSDFVSKLYINSISKKDFDAKENYLYRRVFFENNQEIADLVSKNIQLEIEKYKNIINNQNSELKKELDKLYQVNTETVKNSTYDLLCRFNQLEKVLYEKVAETENKFFDFSNKAENIVQENNKQIYDDISKIYNYIDAELNKKGAEINKIYEEISKNYNYTEKLIEEKKSEIFNNTNNEKDAIWQKINELDKEIILRYVNLKRIFDMKIDELQCGSDINKADRISDSVSQNIEKIYARIDDISSLFYKELSNIYEEFNNKLIAKKEEEQFDFERRISELKNEFEWKTQALKEEFRK